MQGRVQPNVSGSVVRFRTCHNASEYVIRILNNTAIFIVLAVSYNLINGITGQFPLEPNAFVAIGAYTTALLTLTRAEKELSFIIDPLIWPLNSTCLPWTFSVFGLDGEFQPSPRLHHTHHFHPLRIAACDQIVQDTVGRILGKQPCVP